MRAVKFVVDEDSRSLSATTPASAVVVETDRPEVRPGEVLIAVHAAGVNMADLLQRQGRYPAPAGASDIPGLEVSGVIVEVGEGVVDWQIGQHVCALLSGGGYAEFARVDSRHLLPVPSTMTHEEAAGVVEVAATTWANLMTHAQVRQDDWVLIHGGSGGIGSFAIQLLNVLGIRTITTAGSDEKVQRCIELGADHAINYRSEAFLDRIQVLTQGHGVDVILDVMGGRYLLDNVSALASGGRLVIIGSQGGREGTLNIGELMTKRAWVTGTTLRARSASQKAQIIAEVRQHIWPLLKAGKINASIGHVFPLSEVEMGHRVFAGEDRVGKIVFSVNGS